MAVRLYAGCDVQCIELCNLCGAYVQRRPFRELAVLRRGEEPRGLAFGDQP